MPLDKDEYIKHFGTDVVLDDDAFWSTCQEIFDDYEKYRGEIKNVTSTFFSDLMNFRSVHSVRYRIKDSYHLINKIVRKYGDNTGEGITSQNYKEKIQDLMGFRILHLFKDDWIDIHNQIVNKWSVYGNAEANYREGDNISVFESVDNLVPIKNEYGYRSIHYIIETKPYKESFFVEFQVRTIFEEAWAEVNHTICYPNNQEHDILLPYMSILNRLTGASDEMATVAHRLLHFITETKKVEEDYRNAVRKERLEDQATLVKIEQLVNLLDIPTNEKDNIRAELCKLSNKEESKLTQSQTTENPLLKVLFGADDGAGKTLLEYMYRVAETGKAVSATYAPVIQKVYASKLALEAAFAPIIQQVSTSQLALNALSNQASKLPSDSQKDAAE